MAERIADAELFSYARRAEPQARIVVYGQVFWAFKNGINCFQGSLSANGCPSSRLGSLQAAD